MINLGIVGYGFVGAAVEYGFKNNNIFIADPKLGTSCKDFLNIDLDIIFICAPTPMGKDGKIDSSIVESILLDLEPINNIPIVLKSTVTPDLVEMFAEKYENFIYNPEFLTERNALNDFVNPIMHVFGGTIENTAKLDEIYKKYSSCSKTEVFHMTAKEASFVKYGVNTFLSTKVLFWNQFNDICQKENVDYSKIIAAVGSDTRIGSSHTKVPGIDGRKGFGSACFAKDVPAFIEYSKNSNSEFSILNSVWNTNCDYRNGYPELLDREVEQHVEFKKI